MGRWEDGYGGTANGARPSTYNERIVEGKLAPKGYKAETLQSSL